MAQIPSTWADYVGDGVKDTFQVTFPYHKQQEVFVTVGDAPAAFTFISSGWIQLAAVPANGAAIRVQRSTKAFEPRHEFANGVPLLPRYIDENNTQFLYVAQEAVNETIGIAAGARDIAAEARGVAAEARGVAVGVRDIAAGARDIAAEARGVAAGARDIAAEARGVAAGARDIAQAASDKVDAALIESTYQFSLNLADSTDPAKGAGMVGYKGRTVAQKLDELGTAATRSVMTSTIDTTTDGALMPRGAFGLGGTNVNIHGTDLNALSKTGFYMGASLVNAPLASADWFYVLHQEYGGDGNSSQIAIDLVSSTPKTYQRQKAGGIWYPWYEVWNGSTLPVTAFAKTLLDDADAAAARATLDVYSKAEANGIANGIVDGIAIGVGQTWQNVTGSRANGTLYTNSTGKPIQVLFRLFSATSSSLSLSVGGVTIPSIGAIGYGSSVAFIVPAGNAYSVTWTNAHSITWAELR